jgi:glycosyltransferase involved in cell wall biosynthesis
MKDKICFAYPWATFGGCERVFINRLIAFKTYLPEVLVDIFFLSDGGGLKSFDAALKNYGLEEVASVVSSLDSSYDVISLVDCPQLFPKINFSSQRIIVECHTSYAENRRYLSKLPRDCQIVATPSPRFSEIIKNEFPRLSDKVSEIANFVPWDTEAYSPRKEIFLPEWKRKPILFFGRMDRLKNPVELLDAFEIIESRRQGEFMLILCGPESIEIDIDREIENRGLGGLVATMPPIPFHMASSLMESVRKVGGVFVSPSRGESFGLSAAEAISAQLPPVLSKIGAHSDLVGNFSDLFLYQLGDASSLADRIEFLIDNYLSIESVLLEVRAGFSAKHFIDGWQAIISRL